VASIFLGHAGMMLGEVAEELTDVADMVEAKLALPGILAMWPASLRRMEAIPSPSRSGSDSSRTSAACYARAWRPASVYETGYCR